MTTKQLLIENIDFSMTKPLIEKKETGKKYFIEGVFLEGGVKNHNNRIYPVPVIENAIYKYQSLIEKNRAVGEFNHPADRLEIDPFEIAIKVESIKMNENVAIGRAEVLDTHKGIGVRKLMDNNIQLGVSSRGTGTLKESIVQSDYNLICPDVVFDPSAPSAFVDAVFESNNFETEWVLEGGILTEKQVKTIKKNLDNFNGRTSEEVVKDVFNQMLNFI